MNEEVTKVNNCCVKIVIDGAANNPLIPTSPAIDYHYTIELCAGKPGIVKYHVTGYHDGFPSHEIFIGDKLIYNFDAKATGASPMSLFGSGDISVDKKGEIKWEVCKCEGCR